MPKYTDHNYPRRLILKEKIKFDPKLEDLVLGFKSSSRMHIETVLFT